MKLWDRVQEFCLDKKTNQPLDVDAVLFYDEPTTFFFFKERIDHVYVLVNKDSTLDVLVAPMTFNQVKASKTVRVHKLVKPLRDQLAELKAEKGWNKIGFSYTTMELYSYDLFTSKIKKAEFIPFIDRGFRRTKTNKEIAIMKRAADITVEIFEEVKQVIKEQRTELTENDIARMIKIMLLERDCTEAFTPIVACGKNGMNPHAVPSDKKLKEGTLITIDFGAKYKGYCADMTRTLCLGQPKPKVQEVYDMVLKAHDLAIEKLKPGAVFYDLQQVVIDYFTEQGVRDKYVHGLGHGVGVEVHEAPHQGINEKTSSKLMPGDIVTIEPGLYGIQSTGSRFENSYLITKKGFENITNASRELII